MLEANGDMRRCFTSSIVLNLIEFVRCEIWSHGDKSKVKFCSGQSFILVTLILLDLDQGFIVNLFSHYKSC